MPVKTLIPDDWSEELDGWTAMIICVPNSVKWRSTVAGQINALTYGPTWDRNTGNIKDAQLIANQIMESIMPNCDGLFTAISEAIVSINNAITVQTSVLNQLTINLQTQINIPECGCEGVGTAFEEEPIEVLPPIGPGEDFEDQTAYDTYKCLVATTIVFDVRAVQVHLKNYFESGYFLGGVAIVAAVVGPIIASAGLTAVVSTLGSVAKIVEAILSGDGVDFDNIIAELDDKKHELECALFCADSTTEAQAAAYDVLGSMALTTAELEYVKLYFINTVLNVLFAYNASFPKYFLTYDCSDCGCDETPCDWIISPYTMLNGSDQPGSCGTGTILTDGSDFVINSVPFTYNSGGTPGHIICIALRTSLDYANTPNQPTAGQACIDCDTTQWLQVRSSNPANASARAFYCNAGVLGDEVAPAANHAHTRDWHIFRWHRANSTGGAFSMTFRILPS